MRRWEYLLIDSSEVEPRGVLRKRDPEELEVYLNELGREGWEIVALDFNEIESRKSFSGVAKRPLVE